MNGQPIHLNDIMIYEDGVTIFTVKTICLYDNGAYILDDEDNRYFPAEYEHYCFTPSQKIILNSFKKVMNLADNHDICDIQILKEVKHLDCILSNIFDKDYKETEK